MNSIPTSATPRIAAGALFVNKAGRPLLVKPTYKNAWSSLRVRRAGRVTTRRLPPRISGGTWNPPGHGGLLIVDWAPNERQDDELLFVFDGATLDQNLAAAMALPVDGLERYDYVELAAFDERLPPHLSRRVATALEAQRRRATPNAEHGQAAEGCVLTGLPIVHGDP